ncbi:MAG: tripartite tricarboxylate transporter substrate-binding protein [Acidimicrobiia bacterium]|nr:tripartite tricarboxylate transporter substrate-binding protein [Acidimicrobiia bacterium]
MTEILAGTPAGGGQDRAARAFAAAWGEDVTVTNIPGRGGGEAWDALAGRRGDADVAAISSPTIITNKLLGVADIDHRDLTPIAQLCTEHLAFVVAARSPIATPQQLLDAIISNQVTVALAVARGNINHMALGAVIRHGGGDPLLVEPKVYDSARYAVADVLAGGADLAVVSAASAVEELGVGSLRAIATSSGARLSTPFDHAPTWAEAGVDCVIGTWRGLVAPPGLSDAEIGAWDRAVHATVGTESWRESIAAHRWTPTYLDAAETRAFLAAQRTTLRNGLVDLGMFGP